MNIRGFAVAVAVCATAVVMPAATASAAGDSIHRSGLRVVARPAAQAVTADRKHSDALQAAYGAAHTSPADLAYPWVDAAGTIIYRYTTERGRQLVENLRASATTPTKAEAAATSVARMQQITDSIVAAGRANAPGARTAWRIEPDDQNNRVLVTVTAVDDAFLGTLAARFGTAAVAVRVDPHRRTANLTSRDNDGIPFSGGAKVITPSGGTCTAGFAWSLGMLTAGHCAPDGGAIKSPGNTTVGTVTKTTEENFDKGYGTTYFPGQSTYRGDLALARASSSYAWPKIFRTSSSTAFVGEMWSRSPQVLDQYCTGGFVSGEKCGWTVRSTRITILTDLWSWEWVNNVTEGDKTSSGCLQPGDSGGPVYTVRSDGKVAAKGIISSSDSETGRCWSYFTDIWEAYYGLPGVLRVG